MECCQSKKDYTEKIVGEQTMQTMEFTTLVVVHDDIRCIKEPNKSFVLNNL